MGRRVCLACTLVGVSVYLSAPVYASTPRPVDICGELRHGVSLAQIEAQLETSGFTATAAGRWTGMVVTRECPEMIDPILGELS